MKIQHSTKFSLGKQYEMYSMDIEVSEQDFPELEGQPFVKRAKFLQGQAMLQGLLFKVALGYITVDSPEYRSLKGVIDSLCQI